MPKQASAPAQVTRFRRKASHLVLRRFDPARDSYEQLTRMLHHAFARVGSMGLNCTCVDQSAEVTRARSEAGECFVVLCNERIVGTMTLYARDPGSPCAYYRDHHVATVRQLGIDPLWQGLGIGKSLLAFAEHWAAKRGYVELALDTPYPADHLVKFYRSQGFRLVDTMRFSGKYYDSAILSKAPVVARTLAAWTQQVLLPSASFVRVAA